MRRHVLNPYQYGVRADRLWQQYAAIIKAQQESAGV